MLGFSSTHVTQKYYYPYTARGQRGGSARGQLDIRAFAFVLNYTDN